jgi:uncharacterized membrane protein YkvA (DUF1232 family)
MATKGGKRNKPEPVESSPLLPAHEVRVSVREKAAIIAPADVEAILAREAEVFRRAASETAHPRLRHQAELGLHILKDHSSGRSPQIPYFTISLIAVGLFYFLDEADAIPDWIPGLGTSDDALVLELAFEMGAAGVQRYCDWKGISSDNVLPAPGEKALPPRPRRKS